jgi:hypothetical protein
LRQLPPLKHGCDAQLLIKVAHSGPVYPVGHVQIKPKAESIQRPLFKHGELAQ